MARRPQQQQVRMLRAQAAVQVDHRLLLAIVGTGGDPHRACGRYPRMELFDEALHVRRGDVELQVAQGLHLAGLGPSCTKRSASSCDCAATQVTVRSARRINAASSR